MQAHLVAFAIVDILPFLKKLSPPKNEVRVDNDGNTVIPTRTLCKMHNNAHKDTYINPQLIYQMNGTKIIRK